MDLETAKAIGIVLGTAIASTLGTLRLMQKRAMPQPEAIAEHLNGKLAALVAAKVEKLLPAAIMHAVPAVREALIESNTFRRYVLGQAREETAPRFEEIEANVELLRQCITRFDAFIEEQRSIREAREKTDQQETQRLERVLGDILKELRGEGPPKPVLKPKVQ